MSAYRSLKTLRDERFFATWLTRILINKCYDILRSKKTYGEIETIGREDTYNYGEMAEALEALEPEQRLVTVLFYYNDMTIKEIAKTVSISEGTVKSRLWRAKQRLYELLKEGVANG